MAAPGRRRLSPGDRRNELLALGAEVFGQRPYDEVRIDEIAELWSRETVPAWLSDAARAGA